MSQAQRRKLRKKEKQEAMERKRKLRALKKKKMNSIDQITAELAVSRWCDGGVCVCVFLRTCVYVYVPVCPSVCLGIP